MWVFSSQILGSAEQRKRCEALKILIIYRKALRPGAKKTEITNPNFKQQNGKEKEIK